MAFGLIKRQLEAAYANRGSNPNALFGEKLSAVNTMNHYTARPLTLDRIAKLDRAAMASFYRARFANAADFTFFMVGAFKLEEALPLAARYVGSLPSTGTPSSRFKDVGITFPASNEKAIVEKGREPKGTTVMSFSADPALEENEQGRVEAATTVLEIALRDILREELGETYSVSVGLSQRLPQSTGGSIGISFGSAPENVDKMVERVLQEVRRLQDEGPSADLTNRAKESARRTLRDIDQAEWLLDRPTAVREAARPGSDARAASAGAHRRGDACHPAGHVQEILSHEPLHRRQPRAREEAVG